MADRIRTVVIAGGGTGGHLYPGIAIGEALEALRPDVRVHFVGARRGIEAEVLPRRGLPHTLFGIRGIHRGRGLLHNLGVVPAVLGSFFGALDLFSELRPALVLLTGGYAAAPAGLVASVTGVPLVLQEQNAHPGMVTRKFANRAVQLHVAFPEAIELLPEASRSRIRVSGNPIQPPIEIDPRVAHAAFELQADRPTVLVVGGSQGSAALNDAVLEMLEPGTAAPDWQLLWGTGMRHEASMLEAWRAAGSPGWVHPVGYLHDMPKALGIAEVAVSRAGAMATSEFLAWGLPAILVPLPTAAADHQRKNAEALAEAGCAEVLPEPELSGTALRTRIDALVADRGRRDGFRRAALDRARPTAAHDVARAISDLLDARRAA